MEVFDYKEEPLKFPFDFVSLQESYIAELDAKSGASLKLTVLNPAGRIWTMVAGGGASVIYSDTICDLGGGDELANYGEYSGILSLSIRMDLDKTIVINYFSSPLSLLRCTQ